MDERNIYQDIAKRTDGDIYIGVVGPVRTGKSTFIKKFMDTIVLPNMPDSGARDRAVDELPQSAAGRTIMTTEPKFVPEHGVRVELENTASMNVRLIDCVGYIVPSAIGYIEDNAPRMVRTPWFEDPIPFNMAAEIGTKKVITEHSTIGLVITTDGSISDIPRDEYEEAEERVISELKEIKKPFVVLLNCVDPEDDYVKELAGDLQEQYSVPVMPVNCLELDERQIRKILAKILFEFPVRELQIDLPLWVAQLEKSHWLRSSVYETVRMSAAGVKRIRDTAGVVSEISKNEFVSDCTLSEIDLGTGAAKLTLLFRQELFFQVLGEKTGMQIDSEAELLSSMLKLADMKKEYDKIREAYRDVEEGGYGIVMPELSELSLEDPEIIKQGGKYGVRLRASAPAVHMMKTQIQTELTPIVGSEEQSEELVTYLLREFDEDPAKIWDSNIFGKSLNELVSEGLHNKLLRMPTDARLKLRETIERIINDGCNGLICIIL